MDLDNNSPFQKFNTAASAKPKVVVQQSPAAPSDVAVKSTPPKAKDSKPDRFDPASSNKPVKQKGISKGMSAVLVNVGWIGGAFYSIVTAEKFVNKFYDKVAVGAAKMLERFDLKQIKAQLEGIVDDKVVDFSKYKDKKEFIVAKRILTGYNNKYGMFEDTKYVKLQMVAARIQQHLEQIAGTAGQLAHPESFQSIVEASYSIQFYQDGIKNLKQTFDHQSGEVKTLCNTRLIDKQALNEIFTYNNKINSASKITFVRTLKFSVIGAGLALVATFISDKLNKRAQPTQTPAKS